MTFSERTYQVIIGILVLIIIIGGWFMWAGKASAPSADSMASSTGDMSATMPAGSDTMGGAADTGSSMNTGATGDNTSMAGNDSVSVVDQPAGNSVAVQSVSFEAPGWVAVKDSSGRTLGAAWFPAGTKMNVSVDLLRGTTAGQNYQVLLYADNGDKQFDIHADTLLMGSGGSVAGTTFAAQ